MGLLKNEYIADDCLLGLWEINETFDELLPMAMLTPREEQTVMSFRNEKRRVEWLSVRALINQMLHRKAAIIYNEDNKPFLDDRSYAISISHSCCLTAILVSRHRRVGIDLEYMSHPISRIAGKFMNEKEYIVPEKAKQDYHLYIHWCIKEAIYKICDKQDINFKQNITVSPFDPASRGAVLCTVTNRFGTEIYEVHYFSYHNYVVAYCIK